MFYSVFRKIYLRLSLLMSITILLLLGTVGATTYVVFQDQLRRDSEGDLLVQTPEVIRTVKLWYDHGELTNRPWNRRKGAVKAVEMLSDSVGENIYFLVTNDLGQPLLQTKIMPVAVDRIVHQAHSSGFSVIRVNHQPYQFYAALWSYKRYSGRIYMFHLITGQQQTLSDIATILLEVGASGGAAVVLLNFWFARRSLEPARQTWTTQQALLLELSHELKTPLATITAIATYGAELDRSTLIRETRHASSLLDDILYFAKLESIIKQVEEPVAVSDVTEDTVSRFETLAHARDMSIHGWAESGLYVMCTMERWSHLVSLLFKNATQHGKTGTNIRWRLSSTPSEVSLTIENHTKPSSPSSPDTTMSGIGLRIAERLVKDMRGRLEQLAGAGRITTVITVPRCHRKR